MTAACAVSNLARMTIRILMAGGTGLIGGLLTRRLVRRSDVELDSLVRSPALPCERRIDFEALAAGGSGIDGGRAEVGISCLGTTLRVAGSATAFRRVDHDYVVAFAKLARGSGATRFMLVSSVGAGGSGLYLTTKGDTEAAIRSLGFDRVDIMRPSLLLGPRADRRPAEFVAQRLAPLLNPVLFGPLARYAALDANVVAGAMAQLATHATPGVYVHHVPEIRALARG